MDEIALIRAAQSGDSIAFEQLLEARYDTVYRFAYKWCGNPSDAEDITQLACMKLAQSVKKYDHKSKFSTWLYRVVINCAKDWQRQQARHQHQHQDEGEIVLPTQEWGREDKVDIAMYLQQLIQWLAHLGQEFKETILLVFGEGLSHGEAARVMDVKESTISWRIHHVRKKLSEFEQSDGGPP